MGRDPGRSIWGRGALLMAKFLVQTMVPWSPEMGGGMTVGRDPRDAALTYLRAMHTGLTQIEVRRAPGRVVASGVDEEGRVYSATAYRERMGLV